MRELKDILLEGGDVSVANGDFVVGLANDQNRELLLISEKGEWKEHPMRGVGAARYLEGCSSNDLAREIQTEYTRDGMRVRRIKIELPTIEVEAEYED